MGVKILVVGFQRSGTTLLRRMIQYHPQVRRCFHETFLLKDENFDRMEDENWGEKIPWFSKSGNFIISYIDQWISYFGDDSRILHIIRDPIDVANSNMKFLQKRRIIRENLNRESIMEAQNTSVSEVCAEFHFGELYLEIMFEDLVTNPVAELKRIYGFCDLDDSDKVINEITKPGKKWRWFGKINSERAFAHQK